MFPDRIDKDRILQLPLTKFDGEITLVDSLDDFVECMKICNRERYLGFDTEKKPTFQRGQYHHTALVQLSTLDRAFLIRLNVIGFLPALVRMMANPDILKVGISILDDIKALQKMHDFEPAGFVELNDVAADIGVKDSGVKKLAAIFLESRISKNQQTSNWENAELTEGQQRYAATDAWVCAKIYDTLLSKGYLDD
ncbi:MAG: 3'-5' exonuclease [Bacteroidota bacterium]